MKTTRIALTALALLVLLAESALCQVWQEQRITTAPEWGSTPKIWGDTVYYKDSQSYAQGYLEMKAWDPVNGKRVLTQVPMNTILYAAQRDRLVYAEYNSGGTQDLYMWDPSFGKRAVCTASGNQRNADISGQTVVWEDYRSGKAQVYVWDPVNGERHIAPTSFDQTNPRISENGAVVWEDRRNGRSDVYMWKPGEGERRLSTYAYGMCSPAIYQDRVVMWILADGGYNADAGLWQWTPTSGLHPLASAQLTLPPTNMRMWERTILWSSSGSSGNVIAWDPVNGSNRVNQSAVGYAGSASIYGNRVAWVGNNDIYLSTLVPEPSGLLVLAGACTGMLGILIRRRR